MQHNNIFKKLRDWCVPSLERCSLSNTTLASINKQQITSTRKKEHHNFDLKPWWWGNPFDKSIFTLSNNGLNGVTDSSFHPQSKRQEYARKTFATRVLVFTFVARHYLSSNFFFLEHKNSSLVY